MVATEEEKATTPTTREDTRIQATKNARQATWDKVTRPTHTKNQEVGCIY